jgi:hypothetical protein
LLSSTKELRFRAKTAANLLRYTKSQVLTAVFPIPSISAGKQPLQEIWHDLRTAGVGALPRREFASQGAGRVRLFEIVMRNLAKDAGQQKKE